MEHLYCSLILIYRSYSAGPQGWQSSIKYVHLFFRNHHEGILKYFTFDIAWWKRRIMGDDQVSGQKEFLDISILKFFTDILICELWGVNDSSLVTKAEHDHFVDRIKQLWTFSSHWWTSLKTGDIPFMRMPMWPLAGWRWERMSWFIALPGLTGRPTFFIHPSSIYMTVDGATPALADCPAMSFVFVYWHSRKWWPPLRGGSL